MKLIEFSLSDVSNEIDQGAREVIADLVLSWARFDSLVTHWTFRSFGMGPDEGSILVGSMGTRAKLVRIKSLNAHFGMTSTVEAIDALLKQHDVQVEVRNTLCHKACAGHSKSDPDRIIFANAKVYPKMPGRMLVELVHLDQIRAATEFAKVNADMITEIVDALIAQLEQLRRPPANVQEQG